MSANRIVRRRAWITGGTVASYHDHLIDNKARHPSFQSRVRAARKGRGHRLTSSDTHHFYGQRY